MNIKKTIGMSMIALLVVALSVGMAAAWVGFQASPTTLKIQDDANDVDKALTLVWYDDDNGQNITAAWKVLKWTGGTTWVDSNEIRLKEDGSSDTFSDTGTRLFNASESVEYDLQDAGGASSAVGDIYHIEFRNANTGDMLGEQTVTVTLELIPEFTTIAIPVLALLGLVLYMRRKKD